MEMAGEERIAARREVVWAALNDPEILKQCISGCRELDWVSPTGLTALVKVKFGPLSISFSGDVALSNMNPPESYTIEAQGKGSIAGFARGGADVRLTEDGDQTILEYNAWAEVGGKVAQLASRFIDSSASALAQHFFADFNAAVSRTAEA